MRTFKNEEDVLAFLNSMTWGNAAGTCREAEYARKCAQVGMTSVVFGSLSMNLRAGNAGGDFYYDELTGCSINALGLPNRGFWAYFPELPELRHWMLKHTSSKLWVDITTGDRFEQRELARMASYLESQVAADVVVWNSSCPNVEVGGKRKPVVCFDHGAFREGVLALSLGLNTLRRAVKISPITEASLLAKIVEICLEFDVDYLVFSNTEPNCYMEKPDGTPALPGMIRGGMGGRFLIPKVSAMIQMVRPMLQGTKMKMVVVGGIVEGGVIHRYLRLGGDAIAGFQFNTILSHLVDPSKTVDRIMFGDKQHPGLIPLLMEKGLPE